MAPGTSGPRTLEAGSGGLQGPLSRGAAPSADASTSRVASEAKAEALEPRLWGPAPPPEGSRGPACALLAAGHGAPCGLESPGTGACLWPTQLLGRWPATLVCPRLSGPWSWRRHTRPRSCVHSAQPPGVHAEELCSSARHLRPACQLWCHEDPLLPSSQAPPLPLRCSRIHWGRPELLAGLAP